MTAVVVRRRRSHRSSEYRGMTAASHTATSWQAQRENKTNRTTGRYWPTALRRSDWWVAKNGCSHQSKCTVAGQATKTYRHRVWQPIKDNLDGEEICATPMSAA